jgi:hypothetical protein
MLLVQSTIDDLSPEPRPRRRGGIFWQPRYEGFTRIAYRDGRAIAGISGPWSDQYVLIWWQPAQPVQRVEVFDSLEAATRAVATSGRTRYQGIGEMLQALCSEPIALPRPAWLARLRRWQPRLFSRRAKPPRAQHRPREATDLRGMNLRAVR